MRGRGRQPVTEQTRHGYAATGEHVCKYPVVYSSKIDQVKICGRRVPEGTMPWLAKDSRNGSFLALCLKHRRMLDEETKPFLAATVETGRLLANSIELADGQLMSHTEIRELLREALGEEAPTGSGPLAGAWVLQGIELKHGPEARRKYAEARGIEPPEDDAEDAHRSGEEMRQT